MIAGLVSPRTVIGMQTSSRLNDAAALPKPMRDKLTTWANANKPPTPPRVLLKHGHVRNGGVMAPPEYRGPSGHCFRNSMLALAKLTAVHSDVRYCEGYAYKPDLDLVLEHGWLLVDGRVWETTWPARTALADVTYLGMEFDLHDVLDLLDESEETPLFGDWDRHFRLANACGDCCGG